MSSEEAKAIPSNEEIINELTESLQAQCSAGDGAANVPGDFDKPDDETEKTPEVPDDFVDEDALRDFETGLSDEEKAARHEEAAGLKTQGNEAFRSGNFLGSVEIYTKALRLCPLDYKTDRAVYYCNRAASKISLERKQSAIDDCSKAVELNPTYIRAYLRRAKLYEETEKLDESLEDFKKVLELDPGNKEAVMASVRLPPLINERNEKLKTEMLGKLKDFGNVLLRPFGLSTDNFKVQQDPNSGSYSINFQQNSS